jgi:hypothetical protein
MTIKVGPHVNDTKDGKTVETVVYALVQQAARGVVSGVTNLTDSSAGTAGSTVVAADASFVDTAVSGSNLATKASAEAALVTVQDALKELATKANEYAGKLGVDQITYNGGGAAADGTIGAVTVATTGGATGPTNANLAPIVTALNTATYNIAILTNKCAKAVGATQLTVFQDTAATTVAALSTNTGTAATPGVTKVELDASLVTMANNIATIAAKLNAINDGYGNALVVAV